MAGLGVFLSVGGLWAPCAAVLRPEKRRDAAVTGGGGTPLLPEAAGRRCYFEDLFCCVGFPGVEDRGKFVGSVWCDEDMDVVRHDDEFVKPVTVAIEVRQGLDNAVAGFGDFENARSVPGIEPLLKACLKALVVFLAGGWIVRFRVRQEPLLALPHPGLELRLRNRVAKAEGHKIRHSILTPMRQASGDIARVTARIEESSSGVPPLSVFGGRSFVPCLEEAAGRRCYLFT